MILTFLPNDKKRERLKKNLIQVKEQNEFCPSCISKTDAWQPIARVLMKSRQETFYSLLFEDECRKRTTATRAT